MGLLRADSGFYTQKILETLEFEKVNYLIATRLYPNSKHQLYGLDDGVEVCPGIEINPMYFAHEQGPTRRYIVVRKAVDIRPKSGGKMLLDDPDYRFSCYVTNMDLPVDALWNSYNGRADCENSIKALKQDFGLDQFCLKDFWATEAAFRFIMIAYHIMGLFRFFSLQSHSTATLKTLRAYCFALGAWTVNHSNKKVLKIALPVKKRPWMMGIFTKIEQNPPPFIFPNA